MSTKPKLIKLVNIEYNETLTIALVEKDEQLRTIFADELRLPFSLLITLSKQGELNNVDTKALLRSIFDDVIVTQSELIRKYKELAHTNNISISEGKITDIAISDEAVIPTVVEEVPQKTEDSFTDKKTAKTKAKKESELPRRYGKEKIQADINKQGGKATPLQLAMLRVNDLKNIYVNLQARGIKDMVGGANLLSDADCRDISSAITIIERKLETILKRKK
jgi:hypothetical protein